MQLVDPNNMTMDFHRRSLQSVPGDQPDRSDDAAGAWIRHGWEEQYTSEEYLNLLNSEFYMYYTDKRHETGGNPREESQSDQFQEWRMRQRLKTVSAALVVCLNLGVDPPDVVKTHPCAKLECWVDPTATAASVKAMEQIGKNLQAQYETLSIRTRYKQQLDPSVEETKKFCCSLRRNATDERILFHYNGHGVPKPTSSGEIWVFNRNFTQYIPISLYDLQTWLGAPSLFVYDCAEAGTIIHNFNRFIEKHETENAELRQKDPNAQIVNYSDCIQLGACATKETLPTNPDLPADLFTSCLTTPIEMSLRFFVMQNPLPSSISLEQASKVPGRLQDRRSPLGELNWIFTAITDTIAWNYLPHSLFKKLFRQDLMVAALFRNFLLSQRIMRVHGCHPQSSPEIPDTHQHPMWQSWDLALEMVLAQLPAMLEADEGTRVYEYKASTFFTEQLTAFEVYLSHGAPDKRPPDQLPVVLQVLMSQIHRLRALVLLSKFLDLGPWAVMTALSIGIFTYVLRLLQSAANELRPVLVFIWARLLAVDQSCQVDLLKDSGYRYFIQILKPDEPMPLIQNVSEHRAMCAFILAMFCRDYHQGQVVCTDSSVMTACLAHLDDRHNPLLRQWACLCISQLWVDYPEAKWLGIREMAPQRLCELAYDPIPEVRAAMLYALNNFLGIPDITEQVARTEETLTWSILPMANDSSSLVRKELLVFFSTFVKRYENNFMVAAHELLVEESQDDVRSSSNSGSDGLTSQPRENVLGPEQSTATDISQGTIFAAVWKRVLILSVDPHAEVARSAGIIVDCIHAALLQSPLGLAAQSAMNRISKNSKRSQHQKSSSSLELPFRQQNTRPATPTGNGAHDGDFFGTLKRTASIAAMASLKHFAFGSSNAPSPPRSSGGMPPAQNHNGPQINGPPRSQLPAEWSRPPDQSDQLSTHVPYRPAKVPKPPRYKKNTSLTQDLPLQSTFLAYSMEYFREPQMKPEEADEPGSTEYNERLWRRTRNDKVIDLTQPQKEDAANSRWDVPAGFFDNGSQPMKMCFHQFEDHLAVADDRDTICIWDWQAQQKINRFSNANPVGTKINDLRFINEDDQAYLMTGSSDGAIRLYKNYESESRITMMSSWRALTDLVNSNFNAGLVFEWQQGQGRVLVAGDIKVIRVWNAATEICTTTIPARSGSCVTSLTSDQVAGHIFVAGFGDGAVRVYDQRLPPRDAMVRVWKDHKQWITNVHMQRGGTRELVSGSRNGDVKLWDIRMSAPLSTIRAAKDTLRTLSVHEHAPVFAAGTAHHSIKVFNVDGRRLSGFEPYSGFLHQHRSAPISSTCFHPHRMMLACSALNDNHVNVFSCDIKEHKEEGEPLVPNGSF
ncbi:MAG: hypothetical protein M1816_003890 [Peltula sp. TS41687]|nr:MAG: hypothetical protein M1816_003890 [Peltula sp. TS41687]